jgi:hypothetical protein
MTLYKERAGDQAVLRSCKLSETDSDSSASTQETNVEAYKSARVMGISTAYEVYHSQIAPVAATLQW